MLERASEKATRWAKKRFPGLVNFVPAVDYLFCLNLPEKFSQPGTHFFARPCKFNQTNLAEEMLLLGQTARMNTGVPFENQKRCGFLHTAEAVHFALLIKEGDLPYRMSTILGVL